MGSYPCWDSKNSFLSCAITTAIDGNQDKEIHCFSLVNSGREQLQTGTSTEEESDKDDPFATE